MALKRRRGLVADLYRESTDLLEVGRRLDLSDRQEIRIMLNGTISTRWRIGKTRRWTRPQTTTVKPSRVWYWVRRYMSEGFHVKYLNTFSLVRKGLIR